MPPVSILVADDESNIRMTLRTALESDGYKVLEAADGREALAAIHRRLADLVVLDLNMPVLDGMAVLEEMNSMAGAAKPKVIVLTAYGSLKTAIKATKLGAVDFLEKPIAPAELRQAVKSVLNETELDSSRSLVLDFPGGYEEALDRVRKALRLADYESAEALLMKAADRDNVSNAEYFNLLGVLYEAQRKWRLARKCYGKAIAADNHYEPARSNIRRLDELQTYGRSTQAVVLGDEAEDVYYAHLPSGDQAAGDFATTSQPTNQPTEPIARNVAGPLHRRQRNL
jgi:DNA-binding response OmpR family regulator